MLDPTALAAWKAIEHLRARMNSIVHACPPLRAAQNHDSVLSKCGTTLLPSMRSTTSSNGITSSTVGSFVGEQDDCSSPLASTSETPEMQLAAALKALSSIFRCSAAQLEALESACLEPKAACVTAEDDCRKVAAAVVAQIIDDIIETATALSAVKSSGGAAAAAGHVPNGAPPPMSAEEIFVSAFRSTTTVVGEVGGVKVTLSQPTPLPQALAPAEASAVTVPTALDSKRSSTSSMGGHAMGMPTFTVPDSACASLSTEDNIMCKMSTTAEHAIDDAGFDIVNGFTILAQIGAGDSRARDVRRRQRHGVR